MKILLLVLGLALAGAGAYFFYFRDHPISLSQGPESASGPDGGPGPGSSGKKDFKEVNARLQSAMDHVPANLREARQMPTYAFDTRSRLAPYVQMHAEYVTLTQACDLIINADQAFADHQVKCGLATGTTPQERARAASAANAGAYQQQQTIWENQRRQADSKVRQLLATLENKRL